MFFANHEVTLAGSGVAALLGLPGGLAERAGWLAADAQLRALETDDPLGRPGTGPVALGALAFELDSPGALVVPAVLYGRAADGTEWVTVTGEDTLPEPSREWLLSEACSPRRMEPTATMEIVEALPADYPDAVTRATLAIAAGGLRKVVLGRRIKVKASRELVASATLARLREDEPSSTAFLIGGEAGAFVGASPELLVSRRGARWSCRTRWPAPRRSTTRRPTACSGRPRTSRSTSWSSPTSPACSTPSAPSSWSPASPPLVALHTMAHLGTRIEGRLMAEGGAVPSALELVAALHPTPAVGGVPRAVALALIAALEPGPRGRWAGPVGWTDAAGDGDWMIGLRSAWLSGDCATLWAGAGIVAASDPERGAGRDDGEAACRCSRAWPRAPRPPRGGVPQVVPTRSGRSVLGAPSPRGGGLLVASGIATSKVAPWPGTERTLAEPPRISAIARTMERPSPLPPPVRAASSRQNRSNTRLAASGLSPGPLSETVM